MLKILMHCPNLPPDISGGGKQAVTLANKLKTMGYEIIFLANKTVGDQEHDKRLGFDIIRMKGYKLGGNNFDLLVYWIRVLFHLIALRKKVDIVHCHGVVLEIAFTSYAANLLGKKTLLKTSLEGELSYLNKDWRSARLLQKFLESADKIVAISNELLEEYKECPLQQEKVIFIPNGVNVDLYRPVPAGVKKELAKELSIDIRKDQPLFVYHGVIMERKSIHWVVEQLKDYLLNDEIKLMVVGDPSRHEAQDNYYKKFVGVISELGLIDKVILRGFKDDVYKYLQISDVYVTASLGEGLSNSLLEAMAVGLFPIASKTSGTSQVITNGENGLMFDCLDEAQFKDAVNHYLRVFKSDEEDRVRRNAINTIEKDYSIYSTAKKYSDLYEKL